MARKELWMRMLRIMGIGSDNNDSTKSFTFRVKNNITNYSIYRINVNNNIDENGLNISYGEWSNSISFTLPRDIMSGFNIFVHYDDNYPAIRASIEVCSDWPTSFDLRLYQDGYVYKLSRIE